MTSQGRGDRHGEPGEGREVTLPRGISFQGAGSFPSSRGSACGALGHTQLEPEQGQMSARENKHGIKLDKNAMTPHGANHPLQLLGLGRQPREKLFRGFTFGILLL